MADDILKDAKAAFQQAEDAFHDAYSEARDDVRFARLGDQWPEGIKKKREAEGRPSLTINKMPAFIRQVVNDARQNKPTIRVHPVDDNADRETAEVINDLIRNIEYTSSADIAYDTATECAVTQGFGFFRIDLEHAREDSWDLDIRVNRIVNPFSVYGDPASTAADSSDWNTAFETQVLAKDEFEKRFKGAQKVDWNTEAYSSDPRWTPDDKVLVASWWIREEYDKKLLQLSDGTVQSEKMMQILGNDLLAAKGIQIVGERVVKCYRVKCRLLTAAEVLEDEDWVGQYIPIIPVYGDEFDVEGKRYFRSLIRDAKDAQRMFNYWRTMTTELIALAPKTPFIGPKGAFNTDAHKWATANTENHSYIEYDQVAGVAGSPQRQPFVGVPAGAMQEALSASDDMKAIMGLYDASLGARSNETSGRAIMARQREGDVSTFHFQDNMARAIRHAGRVLLDLIPHVYDQRRMIRVIGEDGTQRAVPLKEPVPVTDPQTGQPVPQMNPETGEPMMDEQGQPIPMTRIYDLSAGKYDLTVSTGPNFTSRREEAAMQMQEFIRAFPAAAPVIGDLLAKNLDWPGADEIAERLKAINPALQQQQQGIPPEMQQQIEEGQQRLQQLEAENQNLKAGHEIKMMELQVKQQELRLKEQELQVEMFRAQTERMMPPPEPKIVRPAA